MSPSNQLINVMVDTETLALQADACILSIGATVFCPHRGMGDDFYKEIDPESYPGKIETKTLRWWFEQVAKGTPAPMGGTESMGSVLQGFQQYLLTTCSGNPEKLRIWANGTDFDISKLYYWYDQFSIEPIWKYSQVRDARTIYKLFGGKGLEPAPQVGKHNAYLDSKWQAEYLINIHKDYNEHGVYIKELAYEPITI